MIDNEDISMTDNYEVTFSPTVNHLDEIEKWLIEEDKESNEGFYCNWDAIKSSFDKRELTTISLNDKTVGFATWRLTTDNTARIEIAEIKPSERGKGIGKMMIGQLIGFLEEKNIDVIDLQCAPARSEPFWKHLGFVEFPAPLNNHPFNANGNKKLYKILNDHLLPSSTRQNEETIELWNDEPYKTNEIKPPTYIWDLEFINGTRKLSKPIIHPAHYEWRLRWTKNGQVMKDDKVKRFIKKIDFCSFIIIEELSL